MNKNILKIVSAATALLMFAAACESGGNTGDGTEIYTDSAPVTSEETQPDITENSGDTSETEEEKDVLSDYVIIHKNKPSDTVKKAASDIAGFIKKDYGIEPEIRTDWVGGPVKELETEIVIGESKRECGFSVDTLKDEEFAIVREGKKVFVLGKTDDEIKSAVEYIGTLFFGDKAPGKPVTDGLIFGLKDGENIIGNRYTLFGKTPEEIDKYIAAVDVVNIIDCGADNTGVIDCTFVIEKAHNSGKKVFYPNGTYLFNGKTLDFSGGVEFESYDGVKIVNSVSDCSIVNFDDFGNLIGLMQNHLELSAGGLESKNGSITAPPLSTANYDTSVDFMPIFYNDFGLTRTLTGQYGWAGWFYWSWNFHSIVKTVDTDPYDPSRHPLLGFYYGDDANVLDWQCYWLKEYGINQMIVLQNPDMTGWSDPYHAQYWVYQLFNNAKNFELIDYILEAASAGKYDEQLALNKNDIDAYRNYPHYYTQTIDGKTYAVIYNWLETSAVNAIGGRDQYIKMLTECADYAKSQLGTDGLMVMSRDAVSFTKDQIAEMLAGGVVHYAAGYEYNCISGTPRRYSDFPEKFDGTLAGSDTIIDITTGHLSHTPHPSNWNIKGNTPELFEQWAKKCVDFINSEECKTLPIVTIYNMSEWAEGGPGLQPNVQDGFGYLEAISNSLGIKLNKVK